MDKKKVKTEAKPAPKASETAKLYQLKITLRHITPLIWRRVLVRSDTSIAQMHSIVQTVMGWEDLHLHQFIIHGKAYGIYRDCGISFADDPHLVRLREFKLRKSERFVYEYDMGDWWLHDIRMEQVLPLEARKQYPICIEGDGDCPPEDCGGPGGFMELMQERSSWSELAQLHEDMALIAQRLLDFYAGGSRPTYDDDDFMEAMERLRMREEDDPIEFNRREVNVALRKNAKETPCTSASK